MAPITAVNPLNTYFDPEGVSALSVAYEKALAELHDAGQPPIVQEVVAGQIIKLAKLAKLAKCELDPDRLCEAALASLGVPRRNRL
jgi:hypothetical protein